ncbi:hypothetical protein GCM10009534_37200 [Kribbella sandramycini]
MLAFLLLLPAAPAAAHGVSPTADLQLAQSFAGNELTVVIRRTPAVPGPLHVDVIAHDPVRPVTLQVSVRELEAQSSGVVRIDRLGMHSLRLGVTAAGAHELTLRVDDEVAVIPFRVLVPGPAGWEYFVYGGFAAAGLFTLGGIACAVVRRPGVRAFAVPQAALVAVAIIASGTTAVLSKDLPPAQPRGALDQPRAYADPADGSAPNGRPYANLTVQAANARTGEPFRLVLRVTDGNTGRPVDDVVAHHAALMHLVLTDQAGNEFRHAHPVRTGPGVYAIEHTARTPGRWFVHAEFERADSGSQLVTGSFSVSGRPLSAVKPTPAEVRLETTRAVAGRPITVTARVSVDGKPASDLQPWLGMAGHLVIRDRSGAYFGHVHELTSMAAAQGRDPAAVPDETVAAEGPDLRFTFSVPTPGRYVAWVQFARGFRIHTVPFQITVSEGQP